MTATANRQAASLAGPTVLWFARDRGLSALTVALGLGRLQQEFGRDGIAVKHVVSSTRSPLGGGECFYTPQDGFRFGNGTADLWARAKGHPTRLLGIGWRSDGLAIASLPASGIRTPADLRGRRIGLPRREDLRVDLKRVAALRAALAALRHSGIDRQQVEFVDVPPAGATFALGLPLTSAPTDGDANLPVAEMHALLRGEVDAVVLRGLRGLQAARCVGARVVVDLARHPDRALRTAAGVPSALTVDARLAATHPTIVDRVLHGIGDAIDWAKTHPARVLRALPNECWNPHPAHDRAAAQELAERIALDLSEASVGGLRDFKDFLLTEGFLDADPDLPEWIGNVHERTLTRRDPDPATPK